ncbi:MAG: ATP-binding cassette domain-containing protein [Paracoccaceae bacterium]|nr:ATP-binding cassette domain-containing protein [Paracoccaceae bacterium]
MATTTPLVEMHHISKHFGGIQALSDAHLDLYLGEVLGVLGHNGAGKSTLIKILAGAETANEGSIFIDGHEAHISDPNDARRHGIETIYQELALCGNLHAPANVFMGRELHKWGFLRKRAMKDEADKALSRLNIRIPSLDAEVQSMSGGQRQCISIGRAVHFDTKILIMDEPTAALGMEESKKVMDLIVELKRQGLGIIWISHDIHEVYNFTDRITILNGGRNVITAPTRDFTQDQIVSMIISGRPIKTVAAEG